MGCLAATNGEPRLCRIFAGWFQRLVDLPVAEAELACGTLSGGGVVSDEDDGTALAMQLVEKVQHHATG